MLTNLNKRKSISRTKHTRAQINTNTNTHTKVHKLKTKKKPYKINVYAKNMRYMNSNSNHSYNNKNYNVNKDINKILLSQLAESLTENQWLKVSKDKFKPITHIDKNKVKMNNYKSIGFKPQGSYYSKGGWLFHSDMCCSLDDNIIFIEVDYKSIYRITGKEPYKSPIKNSIFQNSIIDFINKYGVNYGKDKCTSFDDCFEYDTEDECNREQIHNHKENEKAKAKANLTCMWDSTKYNTYTKTKGKCIQNNICKQFTTEKQCKTNKQYHCMFMPSYKLIKWHKLYENYNGFAIYPYPEYKLLTDRKYRKEFFSFLSYDVETLVLWDHTPVIKHHNLGTIRDILKDAGLTVKDMKDKNISSFYKIVISKLIEKINKINNKINNNSNNNNYSNSNKKNNN